MLGAVPPADPGLVLIHSPLVGPSTWEPVAAELRRHDRRAVVARLTPAIELRPPYAPRHADEVAEQTVGEGLGRAVVVAHSASGARLPLTGHALTTRGIEVVGYVFVDAVLPADGRRPRDVLPAEFVVRLDELAVDGVLPPWPQWWPPEALAELVPDPGARALFDECRPIPLDLFAEPVPVPAEWPDAPCAYLSFTYENEARQASGLGWRVGRLAGRHLHQVVDPAAVVAAIDRLIGSR
jgi:hypothetical protein